jgi:predicted Zn-dependent protease
MPKMTVEQMFQTAVGHHKAGRLDEAEKSYRWVLSRQPKHVDAIHQLGVIAAQTGKTNAAINLLNRATQLKVDNPEAQCDLGNALFGAGQLDKAIDVSSRDRAPAQLYRTLSEARRGTGETPAI